MCQGTAFFSFNAKIMAARMIKLILYGRVRAEGEEEKEDDFEL